MERELSVKLHIYLEMKEDETEEQAYDRFLNLLDGIDGISYQDYEHEVNEF